ncbi:golgin subfamily A member 6-like protein 1 [Carassius auratus]|uniref:Golgin subfamily A member 6-like protein 1 n=1 Tax=Carassius auratus TaxID=7957 RepID=A0A6P6M315_CARAU|nr:golgin subfamily A member 6-like protein 1 [Carassius auratus]
MRSERTRLKSVSICCSPQNQNKDQQLTGTSHVRQSSLTRKEKVSTLKNMYSSLTDDYVHHESQMKSENEKLKRELEQHKLKEREWEQKLKEVEDRLRLETDLRRREKELESKERGTTKKEQDILFCGENHVLHLTSPVVSEEKQRSLDERKGEWKSKDEEDSHDSESPEFGKPVRRNSSQFEIPNMTESEDEHLNTLRNHRRQLEDST